MTLPPSTAEPAPAAAAEMAASVELPRAGQAHYNLSDYEALTGRTLTFKEAPLLAARVQAGELPPVDQRLPEEPVVVIPFAELGKYGGSLTIPSMSAASWWPASQATPEYPMTRDMRWPNVLLPGMAEAWGMSEDGKTFTLTFRKGLKWSDGEPFSSDDVLFWWEDYILNQEVTPTIPKYWEPQGHVMEVSKVDDVTVQFQFAVPYTTVQFLGLGLRPPVLSWGVLLKEAQNVRTVAINPWLLIPGLYVVVVVIAFNFVGDGLRDAADPYK